MTYAGLPNALLPDWLCLFDRRITTVGFATPFWLVKLALDIRDPCDLLDFCDVDGLIIDDFFIEYLFMDKSSAKLFPVTPITKFSKLLLNRNLKFYMEED